MCTTSPLPSTDNIPKILLSSPLASFLQATCHLFPLFEKPMTQDPLPMKRTKLRPIGEHDRPLVRRRCANPSVMRFFQSPLDETASDALLAKILDHQTRYGFSHWAVEDRASSTFMGFVGLAHVAFSAPFTPCVEIGWRFLPDFWGCGLAYEAAHSVLQHGFSVLNLPEIVAFTAEINLPSQRVMQRLGMTHNRRRF